MNPDSIRHYYPLETDENDDEYERDDMMVFYKEIDNIVEDEDIIFRYYYCEYFEDNKIACPLLEVEVQYQEKFNSLFGNLWQEPFREWANWVFDLDAKIVD